MEFFRIHKTIPFMKHALMLNIISLVTFLAAVFFIFHNGFNLSIEFTGGTVYHVQYQQAAPLQQLRTEVGTLHFSNFDVQNFGTSRDVLIRLPVISNAQQNEVDALIQKTGGQVVSHENVGSQVGNELFSNGLKAIVFVVIGIILYLAFRFEWKFAVAGAIANLHDVVIILGFFAFFHWEFSLSVLAGVLAVLGYSVNESVVVMDRIRENFRKIRKASVVEIINLSITQNISRTIITHGSTQMAVLSMLFFGGPSLHNFALALTIGIWFGIYSSVFVAAALAMWLGVKREDLIKKAPPKPDEEEVFEL